MKQYLMLLEWDGVERLDGWLHTYLGAEDTEYLVDDTGNRRYWPVRCGAVDLDRLREGIDQLWAEAVTRSHRKLRRWPTEEEERRLFRPEQERRYETDAWEAPIRKYLAGRVKTTVEDIMSDALSLQNGKRQGKEGKRISAGKERKVPMVEAALPLMSRLRDMPTDKHGHLMGVHDRRKVLNRAMALAQIRGHVRFHDLRHTAYTRLKDEALRNLDPKLALGDIKPIFGHSDETMDAVHDHRTMDRLRAFISMTPLVQPVADLLAA